MEKKKRKIKIQYVLIIIMGLLSGFGLCRCAANLDLDAPEMYDIYEEHNLYYNPRTFYTDILVDKKNFLYEGYRGTSQDQNAKDYFTPQMWSEAFLQEIPQIVSRDIYQYDLSEWNLSNIAYKLVMKDGEIDYVSWAHYRYKKICFYEKSERVCILAIDIKPADRRIETTVHDFGDDIGVPQEVFKNFLSRDEVLQIADTHGGEYFIKHQQVDNYTISMELHCSGVWKITYETEPGAFALHFTVDAVSGEITDLYFWKIKE